MINKKQQALDWYNSLPTTGKEFYYKRYISPTYSDTLSIKDLYLIYDNVMFTESNLY